MVKTCKVGFCCLLRTWAEHSQDHLMGWEAWVLQSFCAITAQQFWLQQASVCRSYMHAWYLTVLWTPRLLLGHPGSFWPAHDLKWMCMQTRPWFSIPSERSGTTTWVVHPYPTSTMPRVGHETGTFQLRGERCRVGFWN